MKTNVPIPLAIYFSSQEDKQRKTANPEAKFPHTAKTPRNS